VNRLLNAGTSINAKQPGSGSTPLNTAAVYGKTEIAKLLIEKGADVSLANKDGNTALLIASFFAHQELVELLLQKGASVSVKNGRGETPLDVISADWSPQLEGLYKSIGRSIGIELDLEHIKQARPKLAALLRERAATETNKDPDDIEFRDASIISKGTRIAANAQSDRTRRTIASPTEDLVIVPDARAMVAKQAESTEGRRRWCTV